MYCIKNVQQQLRFLSGAKEVSVNLANTTLSSCACDVASEKNDYFRQLLLNCISNKKKDKEERKKNL